MAALVPATILMVQPVAELLAGLEEGDVLLADRHTIAGARVTADARITLFDRERAETAQLNAVAARQRRCDFIEDRGDDDLDIALVQMGIAPRQPLDELRFRHCGRSSVGFVGGALPCQSRERASSNPLSKHLKESEFRVPSPSHRRATVLPLSRKRERG